MIKAVSYFNPFSDTHTVRDFYKIKTWQKAAALVVPLLATLAALPWLRRRSLAQILIALPLVGLCLLAIFRACIAALAPQDPPPPEVLPPPVPLPDAPAKPRSPLDNRIARMASSLTSKDIQKIRCKERIEAELKSGEMLGEAMDNGDCFYHSLSLLLGVPIEDLRKDIVDALKDERWRAHLKKEIDGDSRGRVNFDYYSLHVGVSHQTARDTVPIWGHPSTEGPILCEKYKFNLKVLKAGVIDTGFENDEELKRLRQQKEENLRKYKEGTPLYQDVEDSFEFQIQCCLRELYKHPGTIYFIEDELVTTEPPYSRTLTLALFCKHFVPVFPFNAR
jgi:hypothetical protein